MTERLLPLGEWHKLASTELGPVLSSLDPERTKILVVEDGSEIVGCWALLTVLHAEGVWIAEPYRKKPSVARRLWKTMRRLVELEGARTFVTASMSDEVSALLSRRAEKLPQEYVVCLPQ